MSDQAIYIVIVLAVLVICLLFALMFSYYFFLKRIAHTFPDYYQQLGAPFLPTASWAITKTINRDTANYMLLRKLLTGLPAGFPDDARLSSLARQVRFEMIALLILIVVGLGLSTRF